MFDKIYLYYIRNILPRFKHLSSFNRLRNALKRLALRKVSEVDEKNELDIFEEEWDNIILIDSCRQDIFEEITGYEGKRVSKASSTPGYIHRNFSAGSFNDIVYIAANPQFGDDRFRELTGRDPEEVFHAIFQPFYDDWDTDDNCIKGEPVIRDIRTAKKLFPDKKIFVHFLQPHHPFLKKDFDTFGMKQDFTKNYKNSYVWKEVRKGNISEEELLDGYKKNIRYARKFFEEAAEILEGTTYLTSDHGNLVGEQGQYGHPANRKEKPLREVPWVRMK